ncbi:MAG TPA: hypothetical protein VJP77_06590, partial [Planctomycetota bacterium]|nr:hypothetical protein [Planctomycetota bacterium]
WHAASGAAVHYLPIGEGADGRVGGVSSIAVVTDAGSPVRTVAVRTSFQRPRGIRSEVQGLDERGAVLWTFAGDPSHVHSLALALDAERHPVLALGLGGEEGLVGLGLDGRRLWSVPQQHVLYEVHARPELPGLVLQVGWDAHLRHIGAAGVLRTTSTTHDDGVYAAKGALFPDADGAPAVLVCGGGRGDGSDVLVRFDGEFVERWRARFPHGVAGIGALVLAGGRPIVLVLLEDRRLLALDDEGALLDEVEVVLPPPRVALPPGAHRSAGKVSAGRFPDGEVAIAVHADGETYLVTLDEGALDGR